MGGIKSNSMTVPTKKEQLFIEFITQQIFHCYNIAINCLVEPIHIVLKPWNDTPVNVIKSLDGQALLTIVNKYCKSWTVHSEFQPQLLFVAIIARFCFQLIPHSPQERKSIFPLTVYCGFAKWISVNLIR